MARSSIDDAYLASAEYGLAMALFRREPARAVALAEQAIARWRDDPGWTGALAEAEAWLREHRGAADDPRARLHAAVDGRGAR
jgi:hypothetical protein